MGLVGGPDASDSPSGPTPCTPQLRASPDDIDLSALWAAVRGVMPKLLIATLAVGVACYAGLSLLTPKYASQAQIEIVSKGVGNPFEPRRDTGTPEHRVGAHGQGGDRHPRAGAASRATWPSSSPPSSHLAAKPEFNSALVERDLFGKLLHLIGLVGPRAGETDDERVLTAYYDALARLSDQGHARHHDRVPFRGPQARRRACQQAGRALPRRSLPAHGRREPGCARQARAADQEARRGGGGGRGGGDPLPRPGQHLRRRTRQDRSQRAAAGGADRRAHQDGDRARGSGGACQRPRARSLARGTARRCPTCRSPRSCRASSSSACASSVRSPSCRRRCCRRIRA